VGIPAVTEQPAPIRSVHFLPLSLAFFTVSTTSSLLCSIRLSPLVYFLEKLTIL